MTAMLYRRFSKGGMTLEALYLTSKQLWRASVVFLWLVSAILASTSAEAMCRDAQARTASNEKALSYFKKGETFQAAKILKVHHPSGVREVASYVKNKGMSYVIFTQVNQDCMAKFIKRTRPRAERQKHYSSRI